MNDFSVMFSTPGFGEITLVVAMIFISVLLLGLLVWSTWHWGIKASATVMTGLFFALTYFAIIDMQGWPTKDPVPEKFQMIWYYADPPNKVTNKKGFIVIWALELQRKLGKKPRAHITGYSLKLHKQLQKARERMLKGKKKIMGNRRASTGQRSNSNSQETDEFIFYDMPDPELPSKQ